MLISICRLRPLDPSGGVLQTDLFKKEYSTSHGGSSLKAYWNLEGSLVRELFLEDDVNIILNIPRDSQNRTDEVIWNHESNGFFSVKSAYKLGIRLQSSNEDSSSCFRHKEMLWKCLWKEKLP